MEIAEIRVLLNILAAPPLAFTTEILNNPSFENQQWKQDEGGR